MTGHWIFTWPEFLSSASITMDFLLEYLLFYSEVIMINTSLIVNLIYLVLYYLIQMLGIIKVEMLLKKCLGFLAFILFIFSVKWSQSTSWIEDSSPDWCSVNPLCMREIKMGNVCGFPPVSESGWGLWNLSEPKPRKEGVTLGHVLLHKINGDKAQMLTDTAHSSGGRC